MPKSTAQKRTPKLRFILGRHRSNLDEPKHCRHLFVDVAHGIGIHRIRRDIWPHEAPSWARYSSTLSCHNATFTTFSCHNTENFGLLLG